MQPAPLLTYAKIAFEGGSWCIAPLNCVADITEGCERFTVSEVQMTEEEFEALPDFNG